MATTKPAWTSIQVAVTVHNAATDGIERERDLIVCDREFAAPDPHYPNFSLLEVDIFSGKDFMLTIRKDLRHGKYQAFRSWNSEEDKHRHGNALAYQPRSFTKAGEGWEGFYDVEVVFESERLQDVLDYCNEQRNGWRRAMGWTSEMLFNAELAVACQHAGSWRERACRD